ncbi:MAG: alkaline phosphatase [Bdellovibrionia bacterium]
MSKQRIIFFSLFFFISIAQAKNVIFFHPDGNSLSHWALYRIVTVGPDGNSPWDMLSSQGLYRSHLLNQISATSNAGATIHAYGVKAESEAFGLNQQQKIKSASGFAGSILHEALKSGKSVALVQTGHLAEPGTAAFVAQVSQRKNYEEIVEQVIRSGVQVIMGGGEKFLIPKGVQGRHGLGQREDQKNLISIAHELGYTVLYTKDELAELLKNSKKVSKLLGVFAEDNTYNDLPLEELKNKKLELYNTSAPTVAEMSELALKILSQNKKGYLAIVEEEGTDNFSNYQNTPGVIEAGKRSLAAVQFFQSVLKKEKETTLIVASDSNAGSPSIVRAKSRDEETLEAQADSRGQKFLFKVKWAGKDDFYGGEVIKADGCGKNLLGKQIDNTEVFKIIHQSLFKTPCQK